MMSWGLVWCGLVWMVWGTLSTHTHTHGTDPPTHFHHTHMHTHSRVAFTERYSKYVLQRAKTFTSKFEEMKVIGEVRALPRCAL